MTSEPVQFVFGSTNKVQLSLSLKSENNLKRHSVTEPEPMSSPINYPAQSVLGANQAWYQLVHETSLSVSAKGDVLKFRGCRAPVASLLTQFWAHKHLCVHENLLFSYNLNNFSQGTTKSVKAFLKFFKPNWIFCVKKQMCQCLKKNDLVGKLAPS